jgi:hypothetical protein
MREGSPARRFGLAAWPVEGGAGMAVVEQERHALDHRHSRPPRRTAQQLRRTARGLAPPGTRAAPVYRASAKLPATPLNSAATSSISARSGATPCAPWSNA